MYGMDETSGNYLLLRIYECNLFKKVLGEAFSEWTVEGNIVEQILTPFWTLHHNEEITRSFIPIQHFHHTRNTLTLLQDDYLQRNSASPRVLNSELNIKCIKRVRPAAPSPHELSSEIFCAFCKHVLETNVNLMVLKQLCIVIDLKCSQYEKCKPLR